MQPTAETKTRPSVPGLLCFYLYIIRYNRNGHGCRPRINGGGRLILMARTGAGRGSLATGARILGVASRRTAADVPHIGTGHGFRARRTGARLAAPWVPMVAKCTQNGGKTGKKAMKWGFLEPRRGSAGAYLQGIQGARAGTRRVAWRLLSREKGAFFAATPA